jgi:hypothetical protein
LTTFRGKIELGVLAKGTMHEIHQRLKEKWWALEQY